MTSFEAESIVLQNLINYVASRKDGAVIGNVPMYMPDVYTGVGHVGYGWLK